MSDIKKQKTESKDIVENKKIQPWYKKKASIIAMSSTLGVGALATVIAVPIVLTMQNNNKTPSNPGTGPGPSNTEDFKKALKAINEPLNKNTRINIWNEYMTNTWFTSSIPGNPPPIGNIVYTKDFINEFIGLLTDNLLVDDTANPQVGSISSANLKNLKANFANLNSFNSFENTTNALYTTNFLIFGGTHTVMFEFKNDPVATTEHFQLLIPASSLDLVYTDDKSIIMNINPPTLETYNNARLNVVHSNFPNVIPPSNYYFKSGTASIKMPKAIMSDFPLFLDTKIQEEKAMASNINTKFSNIKKLMNNDITHIKSLSYWNSFALNYANSNKAFIESDLKKEINKSGILTLLKDYIPNITDVELNEIRSIAVKPSELNVSSTPYAQTNIDSSKSLFESNKVGVNNYKLELGIIQFDFDYKINSLFQLNNAIDIMPKLVLDGKLLKITPIGDVTSFPIEFPLLMDASNIINMNLDSNANSGGLPGFLLLLALEENNIISKLTNSLVSLNSKTITDQITFWDSFALASRDLITKELNKPNILYDFIFTNIDKTNVFTDSTGTNVFPSIVDNTLKNSINTNVAKLSTSDLSFSTSTPAITLNDIQYGSLPTDIFTNISIYFGNDLSSISNINITSAQNSNSNVSLTQRVGETNITNANAVLEAQKRLSIVFTDSANKKYVIYFGQYKTINPQTQITKQIIISSTILTTTTKFIDAIINTN